MDSSKLFLLLTLSFCVNGLNLPPGRNLHEIEALLSMVDMKSCGCSANPRCEIAIPQGRMVGVFCKKGVFCCKRKRLGPQRPFANLLPSEITGLKLKSELTTPQLDQKGEIPTSKIQDKKLKTTPAYGKDKTTNKIEDPQIQTEKVTINKLKEEKYMAPNSSSIAKPELTLEISSGLLATPKQQNETVSQSVRLTPSKIKPVNIPENLFVDVSILGRAPTQGNPIKTTTSQSVKDVIRPRPLPTRHPLPLKSLTTRHPSIRRNGPPAHTNNRIQLHPSRIAWPSRHLGRHPPTRSPAHPNNKIHQNRLTLPFHPPGRLPPTASRPSTHGFRKPFPSRIPGIPQPAGPNHRHVRPTPINRSDNTRPQITPHPGPPPQQPSMFERLWNIKWF